MKRSHDSVPRKLQTVPMGVVCISVVTKSELLYGVAVPTRQQQDQAALDEYLRHVEDLKIENRAE